MDTRSLALQVEEAYLNAWPALRQVLLDGWLLRFSNGLTRRANSVNPISPGSNDLQEKVALCERLYRAQELPTIFRLPAIMEPDLDSVLERRGYGSEGETCVFFLDLSDLTSRDVSMELLSRPGAEWLSALARCQKQSEQQQSTYRRIIESVAVPLVCAASPSNGKLSSVAYGAIHNGLVCLESVATDAEHRRRGLAQNTISAILSWAIQQGATGACVQVEAANSPAVALYRGMGFATELYRYHYRREPKA